jgi:hypothetical protein
MQGVIFSALKELVIKEYSEKTWQMIVEHCGEKYPFEFDEHSFVKDEIFLCFMMQFASITAQLPEQIYDKFADYWINSYTPRRFKLFYDFSYSPMDFILKLDCIHEIITNRLFLSFPPRFEYEKLSDKELIVTYQSQRNLINLAASMFKAIGKFYQEPIDVIKLDENRLKLNFLF